MHSIEKGGEVEQQFQPASCSFRVEANRNVPRNPMIPAVTKGVSKLFAKPYKKQGPGSRHNVELDSQIVFALVPDTRHRA
jgi:hypothetical protein